MARVASNPFGLLREFAPHLHSSPPLLQFPRTPLRLQTKPHGFKSLSCQNKPNPVDSPVDPPSTDEPIVESNLVNDNNSQASSVPQNAEFAKFPNKDINRRIALISIFGSVGLYISRRLEFGVSLKDLSAMAIPYEEALSNGMPTVVEFYADWCEVCRELAPDVYKVEQQYKDRVNFVLLNVDNTKWEQELDEFGVEGIPHFAFLDRNGNEEGNVVGKLPKEYLFENVAALANGESSIPHARAVGQYTSADSRKVRQVADPRSHG